MKYPKFIECPRCGKEFMPDEQSTKFCYTCMFRNLADGLGIVTPPEFLDRYTKYPTLTEREFRDKLK